MHILEGFLPPHWAVFWYLLATPVVAYGTYRTWKMVSERPDAKALLAVAAAFVFVFSALKVPSVLGSTSHPTGTGLAVVLFGPAVTAFFSAIVLLYQAVLLAHGGISTLGANVFSMGVVGPTAAWGAFLLLRRRTTLARSTFVATVVANLVTYLATAGQLAFAFPAGAGIGGVVSAAINFAAVFAVTQVPIAFVEGAIAAGAIGYLVEVKADVKARLEVPA